MSMKLMLDADATGKEEIQALALDLARSLNRDTDLEAELEVSSAPPGSRGEAVSIGTLALQFITSGAAVGLFTVLKTFFERKPTLRIVLEKETGGKLEIDAAFLDSARIDESLRIANRFLDAKE